MSDQDQKRGAQTPPAPEQAADRQTIARRKLLKMAYAAPVIVGTLLLSEDAAAQVSCTPSGGPCVPDGGTCQPSVIPCGPATNPCGPRPAPTKRIR